MTYLWAQLILHQEIQEVITLHPGQQQLQSHLHSCLWVGVRTESELTEINQTKQRTGLNITGTVVVFV